MRFWQHTVKSKWHQWFAWFPVSISDDDIVATVWLETIERKAHYTLGTIPYWDYKTMGKKEERSE